MLNPISKKVKFGTNENNRAKLSRKGFFDVLLKVNKSFFFTVLEGYGRVNTVAEKDAYSMSQFKGTYIKLRKVKHACINHRLKRRLLEYMDPVFSNFWSWDMEGVPRLTTFNVSKITATSLESISK